MSVSPVVMNALATRKRLKAPIHDTHTMPHSTQVSNSALGPTSPQEVPQITLRELSPRREAHRVARAPASTTSQSTALAPAARRTPAGTPSRTSATPSETTTPRPSTPNRLALRGISNHTTRVSAVILTYNEAERLAACLRSVSFCDEILVVDSLSTDGTAELARRLGARVIERPWPGYRSQREFAIAQASHDWILSIDADEVVSPELYREILRLRVRGFSRYAGFEYPRRLEYFGKYLEHGNTAPDRAVRFFDRRHARYRGYQVHERLEVDGPIARLEGHIEHHSYRSLDDHQQRMQSYARIWAQEAHAVGKRSSLAKIVINPLWRFVRGYLLRGGVRDGWRGLVFHCVEAGYVRQKYLNLYALERAGDGRTSAVAAS